MLYNRDCLSHCQEQGKKLLSILSNNNNNNNENKNNNNYYYCIYYTVINVREICIEIKKILPAELYNAQIRQAQTQKNVNKSHLYMNMDG